MLGAAKADPQNAIKIATIANRTDQPQKPHGFVTVVMRIWSVFLGLKARTNKRRFGLSLPQKVFEAKAIQPIARFVRAGSAYSCKLLVDGGGRFPFGIRF